MPSEASRAKLTFMNLHLSFGDSNDSHDLTKSNRVIGGLVDCTFGAAGFVSGAPLAGAGDGGAVVAVDLAFFFSPFSTIVCSPVERKMPPPARLGFAFSRACLASLNELGLGVVDGGIGVCGFCDGGDFFVGTTEGEAANALEETGFIKSSSPGAAGLVSGAFDLVFDIALGFPALGSTISIGMRRRCGSTDVDGSDIGAGAIGIF